jgi:hypothetical protein
MKWRKGEKGKMKKTEGKTERKTERTYQPGIGATAYEIGRSYFVRLATYHNIGRIVAIYPREIVLESACWVADSGRWANAIETGELQEVEPYPDFREDGKTPFQVIINRSFIVDSCDWIHDLPRKVK